MFTKKARKKFAIGFISFIIAYCLLIWISFTILYINKLDFYIYSKILKIILFIYLFCVLAYYIAFYVFLVVTFKRVVKLIGAKDYQTFIDETKKYLNLGHWYFNSLYLNSLCYCGKIDELYEYYNNRKLADFIINPYKISIDFITNKSVNRKNLDNAIEKHYTYSNDALKQLKMFLNEDYKNAILNNVSTSNDFFAFVSYIINIRAKKELNIDFSNDLKCAEELKKSLNYNIDLEH